MEYKREIKFKKKFPFIYIHKRPLTRLELIHKQVQELFDLIPIVYMIGILIVIYGWIRDKVDVQ